MKAKWATLEENSDIAPVIRRVVGIFARSKKTMTAIECKVEYKALYDDTEGHIQANNIHARINEAVAAGLLEKSKKVVVDPISRKTVLTYKWSGAVSPVDKPKKEYCKACGRSLVGKSLKRAYKNRMVEKR